MSHRDTGTRHERGRVSQRFYVETLGCPKNDVDSDKLVGALLADGMVATDDPTVADLVVVNTCAFIEDARRESIDTILALDEQRPDESRLVVTGCMAERYGDELARELPEVDEVAGFGKAFGVAPVGRDGDEVPVLGRSGATSGTTTTGNSSPLDW